MGQTTKRRLAVVATTPDDSHLWNLIGVQLKLEERGFEVRNLGTCTPAEMTAETVRDLRPELLVISTINGHGAISVGHLMRTLEEYQVKRATTIIVGGLLTTDPVTAAKAASELRALGCAAVFNGEEAWAVFDQTFLDRQAARARHPIPKTIACAIFGKSKAMRPSPDAQTFGPTIPARGTSHYGDDK